MPKISSKQIANYFPNGLDAVCGNQKLVRTLGQHARNLKDAPNLLVSGPPGTGKSGCLKAFGKALCCLAPDLNLVRPCGTCSACVGFDCRDTEPHTGLWDSRSHSLYWSPIDCGRVTATQLSRQFREYVEGFDATVIWLDEAHLLSTKGGGVMLKSMEDDPKAMFVATTSDPHRLAPNFRRRFVVEVATEAPSEEDLQVWIRQRAEEWGLDLLDDDAASLLARRSRGNVALCQATLAAAAATSSRCLTADLVRSRQATFDHVASVA